MKQKTAKRVVEALYWLHNNAHYIVGTEFHPTKKNDEGHPLATHIYYQNGFEKMRVPTALAREVGDLIRPNRRPFDTRMFALTPKAKMMVSR